MNFDAWREAQGLRRAGVHKYVEAARPAARQSKAQKASWPKSVI